MDSRPTEEAGLLEAEKTLDDVRARALDLAAHQTISVDVRRMPSPAARIESLLGLLRRAYEYYVGVSEKQGVITTTAEWLLDNLYVIEQAGRSVIEDMPIGYYRRLPVLADPPYQGTVRIYAIAREVVRLCDGQVDFYRLTRFIEAYQEQKPLTLGELWALPTMQRIVELELLARAVAQTLGDAIEQLPEPIAAVELPDAPAEDVIVARAIRALRDLGGVDWFAFVEQVSLVERILSNDPIGAYPRMDKETRNRYRKVVEELAKYSKWPEERIAQKVVVLAEEALRNGAHERERHVGYYLIDHGRRALEREIRYRPPFGERLRRWILEHPTGVYLGGIALFTALIVAGFVWYGVATGKRWEYGVLIALLGLIPASVGAISLINMLVVRVIPPRILPKLDLTKGVDADLRTMVVIPCLLTSPDEVDSLLGQLERHYLSNADSELGFGLLSDFADAPEKHMAGDDALIERAIEGIKALNRKYAQGRERYPFFLFHRERVWNPSEGVWMGWERKRGKLEQLNAWILGRIENPFAVFVGDLDFLLGVRYVITLDADTVMPPRSAQRLIGTLAHPLNRAEFDPHTGRVINGYTILQPRVELKLTSALATPFVRIFGGDRGLDLYSRAVSDVYQDLFGEAIYVGKGIYDVAAFYRSLEGRVPENALLSHDLFEGLHGRVGLVSDVVLYEEYPPTYLAYTQRLHRWARGDWQLLPWLGRRVPSASGEKVPSRFKALDRWKMLDNLRRSMEPLSMLTFLVGGWAFFPGSPALWTLWTLIISGLPLLTAIVAAMVAQLRSAEISPPRVVPRNEVMRWLLSIVFWPYEGLLLADAAITTLIRLYITHRKLLQWTTAAHTARLFGRVHRVGLLWARMSRGSLLGLALGGITLLARPGAAPLALPFVIAWVLSPQIAAWISRPRQRPEEPLSYEERVALRRLARRHWRYFERFMGPEDHWLPPDHFQEDPLGQVAHRTSPTNIGLALLATVTAHRMGYIGPIELIARLEATLETMQAMRRHRGHWLNWYDTHTLQPLPPEYVSTVDSGNLAGALIALRQALLQLPSENIFRWEVWQGLGDVVGVLMEIIGEIKDAKVRDLIATLQGYVDEIYRRVYELRSAPERWPLFLAELRAEYWPKLDQFLVQLIEADPPSLDSNRLDALHIWFDRVHTQLYNLHDELETLMPWIWELQAAPSSLTGVDVPQEVADAWRALRQSLPSQATLEQIPTLCQMGREALRRFETVLQRYIDALDGGAMAQEWVAGFASRLNFAEERAAELLGTIRELAEACEQHVSEMDFAFLFDPQREVFYIGYNVSAARMDESHYDLLASEARLASLIAIAKGDVPPSHWLHLERPLAEMENGDRVLISWNGSMFEYLMPELLTRSYPRTLLYESNRAAVRRQIAYAQSKGVPWGISEAAYYQFDANLAYQYRGFGVPGLGRKRGLGDDLVIAPYATLLALPVFPKEAVRNIQALIKEGLLGSYGFYDAIDYTPERLPIGRKSAIVKSYMVHHEGMSLISLGNYLLDGCHVENFHRDPRIQSVELLLQEGMPEVAPVERAAAEASPGVQPVATRPPAEPWRVPAHAPTPHVHYLSNGEYGVLISNAGGGYSQWQEYRLTRWVPDVSLDNAGQWIYVRDLHSSELWSAAYQPVVGNVQGQEVTFAPHQAEFVRSDHGVRVQTNVAVLAEHNAEIRYVTLANLEDTPKDLLLSSYAEVCLADPLADERHPVFSKLFVQSEYLPALNGQIFWRRPRSAKEKSVYLLHYLLLAPGEEPTRLHEADRQLFLGRGGSLRHPVALLRGVEGFAGSTGAVLDPIMALGQVVHLPPHGLARLCWVTTAAASREEVLATAARLADLPAIERALENTREECRLEMARLGLEGPELGQIQGVLSLLMYPNALGRAEREVLARNTQGQMRLWPFAISGDYPIVLVVLEQEDDLTLLQRMLQAHEYWRRRGLLIDLVILNRRATSYAQQMQTQIMRLITARHAQRWLNRRGGIFVLQEDQMEEADRILLYTAARVVLRGDLADLYRRVEAMDAWPLRLPVFQPEPGAVEPPEIEPVRRPEGLLFENAFGGFTPDGREYVAFVTRDRPTPAPWSNVIANSRFGFLITEMGGGFTWCGNSGENRLTTWRNDPVIDAPAEALYLRDERTGRVWSPTPLPAGSDAPYVVRHGMGYTCFEHNSHGLEQRLLLYVAPDDPVKIVRLRLYNPTNEQRRLTATYYAEWVLGALRSISQPYIIPDYDAETHALLARNPYNPDYPEAVAFLAAQEPPLTLTADRTEFLGNNGALEYPAGLGRQGLEGRVLAGDDPCAAMQVFVELGPGETREVIFLLGQGENRAQALELVRRYQSTEACEAAFKRAQAMWDDILGTVTVRTPEPTMDLLLNRWLLYQALSARIWGRTGFYQSSGAFGFRDQLQDVMALLHTRPEIAREQILEAARHQFEEGDVLHWWHPPLGRGVRTRISDDLLWLPFVTAEYVRATGDTAILDEQVPFLRGEPLKDGEEDRYGLYGATEQTFTLFEHCRRAIERGATSGRHGLPLIGAGDWNDGMNRVGIHGYGESVWLGWFLYATLLRFAFLADLRREHALAAHYRVRAHTLLEAIEREAWDGAWYRRAYYDDGTPLGSRENDECQIDSIAQSWAVLSRVFGGEPLPRDDARLRQAMESMQRYLVREKERLLLLFTPPFDKTPRDPGYIKGYLPGIRENGGQYTHAATWAIWALAEMGEGDRAEALYRMINPILHASANLSRYRVEPYVVAADVYSNPQHVGRGGWTWYTGSAGWMYRLGLEGLLGLRREGDRLTFTPHLPGTWPGFEITYRYGTTVYHIRVDLQAESHYVTLDGETLLEPMLVLQDDGREHQVVFHITPSR